MMKKKENLLNIFGNIADPENDPSTAKKFFQTILYSIKRGKSIIGTRCQMYNQQKSKSSMNLIPDKSANL